MKFFLRIAIFWVAISIIPGVTYAQLPPWTRFKLSNGLEVLVVENHLTPIVTIEISVKNGSFTEPPEYNGLSHLYEHMFFTSNARDTTEDDFLGRVDDLGIVYNGRTEEELVEYYFTLPKQNLEPGLDFMATAITSPLFKPDELHKQQEIVLGEFDRNEALPLFKFGRKVDSALWDGYLSRKEPLGERPTIKSATREKMLTIKNRYYIPNNSLLIVSGDVNTEQIRKLVPKYFDRWQSGPDPFIANPPVRAPPLKGPVLVLDTIDEPRAVVFVRWHGPSIGLDDKGTYVGDVFSEIIKQPEHPFTKSLEESGLAQSVNFWYFTQRYIGPIRPDIVTTPDRLEEAMKTFWRQVDMFDDTNYFTDEELETAKNVLRTQTLYRSEQLSEFTHDLAFWWAAAGLDYYGHYLDDLSKVTRKDIADYIHRYIKGKPFVLGVAMNKEGFEKIGPTLGKLVFPNMKQP
ncbi:MAG: pitrilysin family protein [Bacteroidota bacterium]|nr:pitrilysin family protein [Bacteroidota bacterium]MDP4233474.1 pitrilysin family protein [Bacteroidota bacterium]MDP4243352.1 pitrilysin family protein [Bacteroidota bacterium]MDP4287962.1 pitrilysin family protein [Bacteroidota bacterium]